MTPSRVLFCSLAVLLTACSGASERPAPDAAPAATAAADPSTLGTVSGAVANAAPGTIVVLTPKDAASLPGPATQPSMDQIQMTFVPDMLFARSGYPVAFKSNDTEMHNINVRNPEKTAPEFNRSIPPGVTFEHTFTEAGYYDIRCDIHPAMSASIFVSASPFTQAAGEGGAYRFEQVPPGDYTLAIYNGPTTTETPVTVTAGVNRVGP